MYNDLYRNRSFFKKYRNLFSFNNWTSDGTNRARKDITHNTENKWKQRKWFEKKIESLVFQFCSFGNCLQECKCIWFLLRKRDFFSIKFTPWKKSFKNISFFSFSVNSDSSVLQFMPCIPDSLIFPFYFMLVLNGFHLVACYCKWNSLMWGKSNYSREHKISDY